MESFLVKVLEIRTENCLVRTMRSGNVFEVPVPFDFGWTHDPQWLVVTPSYNDGILTHRTSIQEAADLPVELYIDNEGVLYVRTVFNGSRPFEASRDLRWLIGIQFIPLTVFEPAVSPQLKVA